MTEHERRVTWHTDRCAHFTGVQDGRCAAGIAYVEPLPCLRDQGGAGRDELAPCAARRWTTRAEAEAAIASTDAAIARVHLCLKAIRRRHGKATGLDDSMPCPTGCGGTLHYAIVGGHVRGQCSSGCVSWMQ